MFSWLEILKSTKSLKKNNFLNIKSYYLFNLYYLHIIKTQNVGRIFTYVG